MLLNSTDICMNVCMYVLIYESCRQIRFHMYKVKLLNLVTILYPHCGSAEEKVNNLFIYNFSRFYSTVHCRVECGIFFLSDRTGQLTKGQA